MTPKEQLGQAIRLRREAMGLSRAALARRAGVAPATLSAMEKGSYGRGVSVRHLFRLADALGCTPAELFHVEQF